MKTYLPTVYKAVAGGVAAAATALTAAAADGSITGEEWITVGMALVVGFVGVWVAPANRKKVANTDTSTSE